MSTVKDILGLVVRSITKRILGNNVPPMPKADGTLLFHLKRIKRGVDSAYQSLRKRAYNIEVGGIDNLSYAIDNMLTPVITINGDERISTLGDLMFRDTTKVTEIVDNITDFNVNNSGSRSNNYNYINKLYPNLKKITFAREHEAPEYTYNGTNGLLMPSNIAEEIEVNITAFKKLNFANFIANDSKLVTCSFPLLKSTEQTYGCMFSNCSALKNVHLPVLVSSSTGVGTFFKKCSALEEVYIPNVTSFFNYNGTCFDNCAMLKRVILPKVWKLGSMSVDESIFVSCPSLEEVVMGAVSSFLRSTTFSSVALPNLSKLEVGEGATVMVSCVNWTATNVADDLLNSNFKTYFAERVASRPEGDTSTGCYTFTTNQQFYDRLTEENKTILANKGWTIAISE